MARRNPGPLLPDWHLWAEVTRTVSPLRADRPKPLMEMAEGPLPLPAAVPGGVPKQRVATAPSYRPDGRPGLARRGHGIEPGMRQRLGRGQIAIDGTLDLHGMHQAEAHAALRRFVAARAARGDRTLLVITGKGARRAVAAEALVERGVLRAMLPVWLGQPELAPLVAGWDEAAPGHGGSGAFYVRLRREARR